MKWSIFILILSASIGLSYGATIFSTDKIKNASINIGSWQENYQEVQHTQNGEVNGFELRPYISIGADYHLTSKHNFLSEAGYILREEIGSGSYSKDHLFLRFDYAYRVNKWFRPRIGTSFMWITISGDGEEKKLPNGNGEETYYAPSERKNIFNQTLDLGVEFIVEKLSVRLQNYIYAFNEDDQRINSYSLSVNYVFPIRDLWKK